MPLISRHEHIRGLALVAVAAVVWSTGGLIVRLIDTDNPWTISFWRSAFASLFLLGWLGARERWMMLNSFRRLGGWGVMVGVCFAVASLGFVVALQLTSVANVLVIFATTPLFAAVTARVVLRTTIRTQTWAVLVVAMIGVSVMVGGGNGATSWRGDATAFVVALVYAIATVLIRRQQHISMTPAMAVGTLFGLSISAVLTPSFGVSGQDMALLAVFGGLQLAVGLIIYSIGARMAPPAEVSLVAMLETVLGPIWTWLVIDERPSAAAIVGGIIVITGVVFHTGIDLRQTLRVLP